VGTDPDEGSAMAVAVLEELTRRGAKTIVTTHHGALKEFAFNTPGVENGSMEFEMETLRPTYRFRMGAPGSSYALEIAQRLGLPDQLLVRSRELIGSEKGNLERLILDLERKVQESEKLAQQLDLEKTRLEGLTNLYQERYGAIKKEERALKEKALRESEQILRQANAAVEKAIKEIRERQAEHEAITQAKQLIETEKANVAAAIQNLGGEHTTIESKAPSHLQTGDEVFWHTHRATGRVVEDYDGLGKVLIQVNNLKFRVPIDELSERNVTPRPAKPATPVAVQTAAKSDVLPEINLLGCTLDEAISKTDKFLDDALLAGWNQVRIIHGKGTGVLRKGLAEFLEKHPRVKSKKMGAWNEGDLGVTVVELD
jgi:DNA mismatch repair protein MutS2